MTTRTLLPLALAVCVVMPGLPVAAQEAPADDFAWTRVRTIESGTDVMVTVKGAAPVTRSFVAADAVELTALDTARHGVERIARERVAEIAVSTRAVSKGVKTGALIGAALGALVALRTTTGQCGYDCVDSGWGVAVGFGITAAYAGIGSGIGAAIGAGTQTRHVIYSAP